MANVRREANPEARTIRLEAGGLRLSDGALTADTAAAALGPLEAGGRVFALSKGAVAFGDCVRFMLDVAGPADVLLSTWAISGREIRAFRSLVDDGRVRSLRLVIDPSFTRRHRAYTAQLRAEFGADSIRLVACHAKLATVCNADWSLVLRSSANLNQNARTEFFDCEDSRPLATFIAATFAEWFALPAFDQWDTAPAEHRRRFSTWRSDGLPRPSSAGPAGVSGSRSGLTPGTPEDAAYFGDGWADTDLRRVGLSYVKGGR